MLTTPEFTSEELETLSVAAGVTCDRYARADFSRQSHADMRVAYEAIVTAIEAGEAQVSMSARSRQLLVNAVLDYGYTRSVRDATIKIARKLNEAEER